MKNEYSVILGIDIGLNGALSVFDTESKELMSIYDMPTKVKIVGEREKNVLDIERLLFIMEIPKIHKDKAIVIFEDIHSFGKSEFSMDSIMEQKGIVWGISKTLGYETILVSPKEWQKYYGIVSPKTLKGSNAKKTRELRKEWLKDKSRQVASEIFPRFDHWFEAKTSHGRSDAVLIGKYYLGVYANSQ
jgi:hypothetical protein